MLSQARFLPQCRAWTARSYATVYKPPFIAPPPRIPNTRPDLDNHLLSALSDTQRGLPELIEQYVERSGHIIDIPP